MDNEKPCEGCDYDGEKDCMRKTPLSPKLKKDNNGKIINWTCSGFDYQDETFYE
jgi:hypothetical protein